MNDGQALGIKSAAAAVASSADLPELASELEGLGCGGANPGGPSAIRNLCCVSFSLRPWKMWWCSSRLTSGPRSLQSMCAPSSRMHGASSLAERN